MLDEARNYPEWFYAALFFYLGFAAGVLSKMLGACVARWARGEEETKYGEHGA